MKIPILIAAAAVLLVMRAASAHVVVEPANSAVGEVVTYTVRVPSHLDATTVAVELEIPPGIELLSIAETPGGHEVKKTSAGATAVRWTVKISADERGAVTFVARNPNVATELAWKAHQVYDNGVTINWDEPRGGKQPAAITKTTTSGSAGSGK